MNETGLIIVLAPGVRQSREKRRFFMRFYLGFANSSACTVTLRSFFLVLTIVKYLEYTNSKDKVKKISGITNLKTRLLSSATSNDNSLAPGPRDVLCPEVIYSFVL